MWKLSPILNENIEFDIACKLNWIWIVHWNSIQFNLDLIELYLEFNWIIFKFNRKEMKWKLVEKLLKICLWIWCWQKNLKKTQIQKHAIPCLFTWQWAKQIRVWNYPSDDYNIWNLKLSHLNQFWWIIITKIGFFKCEFILWFNVKCKYTKFHD
jgi:hypothetical protein